MSRTALVVVDMQEYFCRPGHAVARFIVAIPTFATIVTSGDVITARPHSAAPAGL